ncbi:MAG TPA: RDD family protein [Burkholderiales bacterium]|nr:RDD family protein [Burkholderiales bacterium]
MTPGLGRRLASMVYEALLVFGVAFFAAWLFFFASGGRDATTGTVRAELQVFILLVLAGYFLWCWLRGGQTLAMRAWKIRLVDVTPGKAVARFLIAAALLPLSILWALVDRDGQFLHDRLAGTKLIDVRPTTS